MGTRWTTGDAISGDGTLASPGEVNRVVCTVIPAWLSNRGGNPVRYYKLGIAGYYNDTSYYPPVTLTWPDQELDLPPADATGIYYRLEVGVSGVLYRGVEMTDLIALAARVRRSTDQTITTGTPTRISFDTPIYNPFGMWTLGTNPDRITILEPGWYHLSGCVAFAVSATGMRKCFLRINNSRYVAVVESTNVGASERTSQVVTAGEYLNKNDYVELWVAHAAGGDLAVFSEDEWTPVLSVARIA